MPQECGRIIDLEFRAVVLGHDQQELGQRQLALPQQGVGLGEQFLGLLGFQERGVTFAADCQQQRMNSGRIHGLDRLQAR